MGGLVGCPLDTAVVKLIDFREAKDFEEETVFRTRVGSSYYLAPEVWLGHYNQMADIWACGAILYLAISGYPPFVGENEYQTANLVKAALVTFPEDDWKYASEEVKDLVLSLLKKDWRRERFRAEQMLEHR